MLKIILAENHHIVRNGLRMVLEADPEISIVAEAVDGQVVMELISSGLEADVVLADIDMPGLDGISMIRQLNIKQPHMRVMILSMLDKEKQMLQVFNEGGAGYLLKNVSAEELIFSLKHVHSGGKYVCAELAVRMVDKLIAGSASPIGIVQPKINFSSREIEVLHLIAQGLTNMEISDKLFLSKRTIEGHRQSVIEKTGSKNTAALIRFAVLSGLVK